MSATPEKIADWLFEFALSSPEGDPFSNARLTKASTLIRAQAERVRVLEEALRPFVEWHRIRETQGGVTGAPHHSDDTPIFMAASVTGEQLITLGDLRRARAALKATGEA